MRRIKITDKNKVKRITIIKDKQTNPIQTILRNKLLFALPTTVISEPSSNS